MKKQEQVTEEENRKKLDKAIEDFIAAVPFVEHVIIGAIHGTNTKFYVDGANFAIGAMAHHIRDRVTEDLDAAVASNRFAYAGDTVN